MSESRRRVLCLAYHFPPLAGGGIVRIQAFVKYLPSYGYLPWVLTVDPRWYAERQRDEAPLREYMEGVQIVRTRSLMPVSRATQAIYDSALGHNRRPLPFSKLLKPVLKIIFNVVAVPDEMILWTPFALWSGLTIIQTWKPDLILATTPPHSVGLIGAALSRLTRTPLVLDVRDDWVGNAFHSHHSRPRLWLDRLLERFAVGSASRIIAVTEASRQFLQLKYPEREPDVFRLTPNGFDPQAFAALDTIDSALPPRRARVRLVYTGGMTRKRSPASFFAALRLLLDTCPTLADELEVILAGSIHWEFRELSQELGLKDIVIYGGHLTKQAALKLLSTADLGLVIIAAEEGGQTAIPGKVYEYLAAGVHVLALTDPSSALSTLMREIGFGTQVPQHDIQAIASILRALLESAQRTPLRQSLPPPILNRFSRLEHTRQLAACFDELL